MLPLIRSIARDLVRLNRTIEVQREQLRGIEHIEEMNHHSDYVEELLEIRRSLADDELRLQACLGELAKLGVEPHIPIDGSVDFPAALNRRTIRLCWHVDDDEVNHWHEVGQPPEARQRLEPSHLSTESLS